MNKIITKQNAIYGSLLIMVSIIIFHLLILAGIVPYNIVWGGRLSSPNQMFWVELLSITVNIAMLFIVGQKAGLLRALLSRNVITTALWVMCALFVVNTFGNMLSVNSFEKLVFTPLTFLLALFSWKLATSR